MTPYPEEVLAQLQVPMDLVHMKGRLYVDHLLSVHAGLTVWCLPLKVRLAGLLHSIYGTERFDGFKLGLDKRPIVTDVVGAEAELLAYANCAIVREDFDMYAPRGFRKFPSRFGGEINFTDGEEFRYLCAIQLCDWLDQVVITGEWEHRFSTYIWIADLLGGAPQAAFYWVYRNKPGLVRRSS